MDEDPSKGGFTHDDADHAEYGYGGEGMYSSAAAEQQQPAGRDYYAILGVDRCASSEEIRRAYRRRALDCHPDRAGDSERKRQEFFDIQAAYEILSDPKKRTVFDKYGEDGLGIMDLAGVFSFVLHTEFGLQTFLYMSVALVGVALLLLFSALLAMKYDKVISIPWPNVFAPLYVFLIIFVFPCCFAASLEQRDVNRESSYASGEYAKAEEYQGDGDSSQGHRKYLYWLMFVSFVTFSAFFPTHFESNFPSSWIATFSPLMIMMVSLLALKADSLCRLLKAGIVTEPDDSKNEIAGSKDDIHDGGTQKHTNYSLREKIILIFAKHTTVLSTIQIFLVAFKLDGYFGSTSWRTIFIPSWIWAVADLFLILSQSLTPSLYHIGMSNAGAKFSNTSIFFIVFVPNFILLVLNSILLYPILAMLQYRLDNPRNPYYSASLILAPVFVLLSLLSLIIITSPIIAVALRKYLLKKFGRYNSPGAASRHTAVGLIAAKSSDL